MSKVELRNIGKAFGKNEIIKDLSLSVERGEFVVILGPSGCGKSTLLRMVAGLEAITKGHVLIDGKVVNCLEPRERGCAMVFQNYALYPHMTVAQNIGYALKVAGMRKTERSRKIEVVANALGLGEFLDRKPGQLSGGQKQRVAMARAMIREPKLFLYDEPLSNLDAKLRVAMRAEIRNLHQRLGTTTLFVTHDQTEAMTLADRIVVMNKGRIEQVGTPAQVYTHPASAYVAGFIGAPGMNLLRGTIEHSASQIRLSDGQTIVYDRQQWPEARAGAVTIGFRAESARLTSTQRGLSIDLAFSEELGASRLLHGKLSDAMVVVSSTDLKAFRTGQSLYFQVDPSAVQLFDPHTGNRLLEVGSGQLSNTRMPILQLEGV